MWRIQIRGRFAWHFVVLGANGEGVLTSETYYSRSNAKRAALRAAAMFGWEYEG